MPYENRAHLDGSVTSCLLLGIIELVVNVLPRSPYGDLVRGVLASSQVLLCVHIYIYT